MHTRNQTNGRGYGDSAWEVVENENLTFSILFNQKLPKLVDLPVFNMWVANSIHQTLSDWQIDAQIKWPNDIMLQGKKMGGILIQSKFKANNLSFIVLGIGLNIYQKQFENLPHATSIKIHYPNFEKSIESCLVSIVAKLESDYPDWEQFNAAEIARTYHKSLFNKGKVATYEYKGKLYNGILHKVEFNGEAVIELENEGIKRFRHKEIQLKY